jgi:hypothetical protein
MPLAPVNITTSGGFTMFHLFLVFLGSFATFLTALVPFLQWRDKKRAEEKKEQPVYATETSLKVFQSEIRGNMDLHGKIVNAAAIEASNACQRIEATAEKIEDQLDANAKEQRETLLAFKMGVDTSLGQVHDKANEAITKVATLEGRVDTLQELLPRKIG